MLNAAIIEELARRKGVEAICDKVTKMPGSPDSRDLAQYVYEILLLKKTDLTGIENIEAFAYRIAWKQWNHVESKFFRKYRSYGKRAQNIDENRAVQSIPAGA